MKTFNEWKSAVNESSLTRINQHIENFDSGSLTGWRKENTRKQNNQNNREILAYLLERGYSVTKIQGNFIENFKTATEKEVVEMSFFVVDVQNKKTLKTDLIKLGALYQQDSVLWIPKGGQNAALIGTNREDEDAFLAFGAQEIVGRKFFGDATGEFLSRVKGREFSFERSNERSSRRVRTEIANRIGESLSEIKI